MTAVAPTRAPRGALAERPVALAVLGAMTIAGSAPLVALADVPPATAAFFRCLYALPVLWLLARREGERRPWAQRRPALLAGVLLGGDLTAWHHAIHDVGAGLATVLGNLQVVIIPLVAWTLLREPMRRGILLALPVVLLGIVLISGVLETGAYGEDPARGVLFGVLTGVAYAGFILIMRHGAGDTSRPAGPLLDATVTAALSSLLISLAAGEAELVPSWPAHGWLVLLALSSQVLGWILIGRSLPRLPAALGSVILTVQPLGSMLLGVLVLGEAPSAVQVAGAGCVLAALLIVALWREAAAASGPAV
jgi:drug/metabolite transporter (DMT)-like permease